MIATATSNETSGMVSQDDFTNRVLIAIAFLKTRGYSLGQIAAIAGYSHQTALSRATTRRSFGELYGSSIIAEATKLETKHETPVTPIRRPEIAPEARSSQTASSGVLEEITNARGDLKKAYNRLMAASESCVPLLRPGLIQMAQRIETLCKDLQVS